MSVAVYVWYRVERDDSDTEVAVRSMMARLACRTGTPGRLLRKQGEPRLWMEVYEGVAEAAPFLRRLEQAVDEFDLAMFTDGRRHTECFESMGEVLARCST